ncbi:unnamed protein product [Acanthoscelides obtectus]|uniref:Uncharacterized protein n=1 Tax=Acanthoscelides obtectus TaxID=200917 RepID=A0A9P0LG14_ACAOB|nr:unnamed protein product [Acanthoscelides obtectus]CAK1639280.1 hypothetical protein AOBTE_LOCUS11094 [Acanthoscelides obtectus]
MDPSEENWNSYKSLRNYCLLASRKEKSAYLEHLHKKRNPKSLYKSLKQMHIQSNKEPPNIPVHLSNPYKMVNKYIRKSNRGSWTEETMQMAMNEAKTTSISSA